MRFDLKWMHARVGRVYDATPTVRVFEIEPEGGTVRYSPGSHIHVSLMAGGLADTRTFSLVDEPVSGIYRIAVKRRPDSRGGSEYMWGLAPGAALTVSEPQNLFELGYGRPEYLLIAGGIGITPIVGMAHALAARRERFTLLYAAKSRDELAFAEDLADRLGDRVSFFPSDEGRRMDLAATINALDPDGEAYLCGPMRLTDEVRRIWRDAQRVPSRLRYETFGSSGRHPTEAFRVRIPRLDLDVTVPANRSMLDVLNECGAEVMSDCERGECGLCQVDILEVDGVVDHRDVFFSDEERLTSRKMCVCVSRACGSIVIDTSYRG